MTGGLLSLKMFRKYTEGNSKRGIQIHFEKLYHQRNVWNLWIFSFFLFYWSIVTLQCHVSFYCPAKWISFKYTYIPSFLSLLPIPHPHPLGYHRGPIWVPCTIQQLPTSYLFYTWYMSGLFSRFAPPFPLPHCVHEFSLCIYVSIPALQIG